MNNEAIAQELQADEYKQKELQEYDDYSYYWEEDYDHNEESYYNQEPDTNDDEENERSFVDFVPKQKFSSWRSLSGAFAWP